MLRGLLQGKEEVIAIVTQPDRGKGRGQKVTPSPVKELALQYGISLLQPEKVRDATFVEVIQNLKPDLIVAVAFGQLLPKVLLEIPRFGAVNVHASLLPRYRGASPISWAILKGEKVSGVTTMLMDEGMDTGDILMQKEIPVEDRDIAETLQEKLSSCGATLLIETIEKMKTGAISPLPQDSTKATYAPPMKKEDGRIDWNKEAEEIDHQVRAFNPWPGAFTEWDNRLLKIYHGEVRKGKPQAKAGSVVWIGADFIEVETGRGSFLIREVQLEGKRRMTVRDFLSGHSIPVGTVFH